MRRRGARSGRSARCLASVTAMSILVRAASRHPCRATPRDGSRGASPAGGARAHGRRHARPSYATRAQPSYATRAPATRWTQFSLQRGWRRFRMSKPFSTFARSDASMQTPVRTHAVRSRPYSTNTCSVHRTAPRRRRCWCARCGWCARSCCSRTTTLATGRSSKTRTPAGTHGSSTRRATGPVCSPAARSRRIRTGSPCAAGSERGARGLWRRSRCACVLLAGELAPECRAASPRRSDRARMVRAGRGPQEAPGSKRPWSRAPWAPRKRGHRDATSRPVGGSCA